MLQLLLTIYSPGPDESCPSNELHWPGQNGANYNVYEHVATFCNLEENVELLVGYGHLSKSMVFYFIVHGHLSSFCVLDMFHCIGPKNSILEFLRTKNYYNEKIKTLYQTVTCIYSERNRWYQQGSKRCCQYTHFWTVCTDISCHSA